MKKSFLSVSFILMQIVGQMRHPTPASYLQFLQYELNRLQLLMYVLFIPIDLPSSTILCIMFSSFRSYIKF